MMTALIIYLWINSIVASFFLGVETDGDLVYRIKNDKWSMILWLLFSYTVLVPALLLDYLWQGIKWIYNRTWVRQYLEYRKSKKMYESDGWKEGNILALKGLLESFVEGSRKRHIKRKWFIEHLNKVINEKEPWSYFESGRPIGTKSE